MNNYHSKNKTKSIYFIPQIRFTFWVIKKTFLFFFRFLYLYFTIYVNFIIKNIVVDSRVNKQKLFIFSYFFGKDIKYVFWSLPMLKILKKWANKNDMAFIFISIEKDSVNYLMENEYIDGYFLTSDFFQTKSTFFSIDQIVWNIKYKNISEKIIFKNNLSFLNFFWNNYIFSRCEWIGVPIMNPYFYWIIRMVKSNLCSIYEHSYYLKSSFYRIIFFINRFFLLFWNTRIIFYKGDKYTFFDFLIKKYSKNKDSYKPCLIEKTNKKILPKNVESFIKNNKKFYMITTNNIRNYKMIPPNNLAKVIEKMYKNKNIVPIFIYSHENIFYNNISYVNNVRRHLSSDLDEKICYLYDGVDIHQVISIMNMSVFSLSIDDKYFPLLYLTGNSGVIVSGVLENTLSFPIKEKYLAKNQKIYYLNSDKSEYLFISIFNIFMNSFYMKRWTTNQIYNKCCNFI